MIPPQAAMGLIGALGGNKDDDKPVSNAAMRAQQNQSMQQMFDSSAQRVAPQSMPKLSPPAPMQGNPWMQRSMAPAGAPPRPQGPPMQSTGGPGFMPRPMPSMQPAPQAQGPMQGLQGNPWMQRR